MGPVHPHAQAALKKLLRFKELPQPDEEIADEEVEEDINYALDIIADVHIDNDGEDDVDDALAVAALLELRKIDAAEDDSNL
jgi:hypothetical protein